MNESWYLIITVSLFTIVGYAILDVISDIIDPSYVIVAALIATFVSAMIIINMGLSSNVINNFSLSPRVIRQATLR